MEYINLFYLKNLMGTMQFVFAFTVLTILVFVLIDIINYFKIERKMKNESIIKSDGSSKE